MEVLLLRRWHERRKEREAHPEAFVESIDIRKTAQTFEFKTPFTAITRVGFCANFDGASVIWANFLDAAALTNGFYLKYNNKKFHPAIKSSQCLHIIFSEHFSVLTDVAGTKTTAVSGFLDFKNIMKAQEGLRHKELDKKLEIVTQDDLSAVGNGIQILAYGYII